MNHASALSLAVVTAVSTVLAPLPAQGAAAGNNSTIVRAADADRSGDVTAAEWRQFIESLGAGDDGKIDKQALLVLVMLPAFDTTRDGAVAVEDLDAIFEGMDRDGDGALSASEVTSRGRGRGQRGGRGTRGRGAFAGGGVPQSAIAKAADADQSGDVTKAEWEQFRASVPTDAAGNVQAEVVGGWFKAVRADVSAADRTQVTPGVYLLTIESGFDANRDGAVAVADLEQVYAAVDANGDGSVAADELTVRRGNRGRRGGGGRITAADRAKPALIPWQRSLDDALALVEKTGKPLLIAVNMDGESASETLAWRRYRDPEFAELTKGFIPVLASPDRRNPRDYDDRGRRVVDQRFGRLINAEHIEIEPRLFEDYFNGQRVAPRHVGVDKDGNILFDIYLTNDLGVIDEALRKHGKPGAIPEAAALDEAELLASPDAGHRAHLEQLFVASDAATRLRLTRRALSSSRKVQHPQLIRLALRDGDRQVRFAAIESITVNSRRAPVDLWPEAMRLCGGRPDLESALIGALHQRAGAIEGDAGRARQLVRGWSGLQTRSVAIDLDRWGMALRLAPRVEEKPLSVNEIDSLDEMLSKLDRQLRGDRDDRELNTLIAETTLRYARVQMLRNQDPTFLLEDARSAAKRATSIESPNPKALALHAWASYLLSDFDTAAASARSAVPGLVANPSDPLTAETLHVLARCRTQALYTAITDSTEWPASWIADVCAAYRVLLDHPAGTDKQAVEYCDFLNALEARAAEYEFVCEAIERYPVSGDLHTRMRDVGLRDGAGALEAMYASLTAPESGAASFTWYTGLALLVAAERHVTDQRDAEAIGAYRRSIAKFQAATRAEPSFASSSNHYIALARAAIAHLALDAGRLDLALESARAALAVNPASANSRDSHGRTPAETAGRVARALQDAGRAEEEAILRAAIEKAGGR